MTNPRSPLSDPLVRAWLWLIALSAAATALSLARPPGPRWAVIATGAAILGLAWLKARVILTRYLGLADYPGARAGFGWGLGLFAAAALALYVAAG